MENHKEMPKSEQLRAEQTLQAGKQRPQAPKIPRFIFQESDLYALQDGDLIHESQFGDTDQRAAA